MIALEVMMVLNAVHDQRPDIYIAVVQVVQCRVKASKSSISCGGRQTNVGPDEYRGKF